VPFAQRSPQPPAIKTGSARKDGGAAKRIPTADPPVKAARARSAKERPEQGRRHLADNSQVSDKAAGSANGAGGFERTAFQDAFLSSPREARQADFRLENPRLWKIFPFAKPSQSLPATRGQGQSPALSAFRVSKPSNRESLPRGGRTRKGGRLLLPASPAKNPRSLSSLLLLAQCSPGATIPRRPQQALEAFLFKRIKGREPRAPTLPPSPRPDPTPFLAPRPHLFPQKAEGVPLHQNRTPRSHRDLGVFF